ncbi:MAG: hypothetical protein H7343_10495 [Undibacterium sp.]|nr:hypothetical protein [Opitutaceae bacterium]
MLVKELRQGLRARGFVGAFIGFQVLMAIVMMVGAAQSMLGSAQARALAFNTANGFFWTLITVQLLLFTPGRALGSLQLEVTTRTVDLLLLTRLNAWRIVTGKWVSLMVQAVLLLVSILPYGIVRYFAGSVDLVGDARQCAALLGGAGLLTAAGLWGAGLGKVIRILGVVVGVFIFGGARGAITAFTSGGLGFAGIRWAPGAQSLVWFDGALLIAFFLVAAVRNIAPPAENHTLLARALPLAALLPVPVGAILSGPSVAMTAQLMFAGFFLLLVCMTQLASYDLPMSVHFRSARRRAAGLRVFLRMTLPGWPSALLYTLSGALLWLLGSALLRIPGGPGIDLARASWLAMLMLTGLIFPCVVMAIAPQKARAGAGVYMATFVTAGALAPLAYALVSMSSKIATLKTVVAVLPVSSAIFALVEPDAVSAGQVVAQGVVGLVVIGAAWWQARFYWQHLTGLELRERREATAVTAG